ncbi:amidase [Bordetella genomosp. 6]|uniref:amidase n=1 Tax=Bordetella genomosp. 6 TaxID=463024 RepID=UPI000A290184|nr:amidase [Bordetella genomosp. 6]ARP74666.1 amidase [Bordetella genomosp. 6]
MNLNRISASEAARLLNRRDLTAEQLARACLARIEQREPEVQAWTALRPDAVLAAARELDRGPVRGVLHGLPLGVKDMFDTVDLPTAYGSGIYQSHQPRADAAAVALCRDAGALVLGKTATTEFATYHPGPTRNPRNTAYTPGGSSSGSAAAVADDMVPLALGTQTAGSVIRPAAYCGVVGYKPSFGRISRAGLKSLAETLDTVGMFARSIDDVALLASVLMRDARLRELRYDGAPRVAMFRSPQWRHTLPETRAAFERAARALSQAGAVVEELAPPPNEDCGLVQLHSDVMAYEAAQALAFERIRHPSQLSTKLAAMLEAGAALTAEQYLAHLAQAGQARAKVAEWLRRYDVLLAPSATGEAPFYDQGTGDPLFCRAWTLFGVPCVHLPFAQGPQGLPVGLQVVGGFRDDQRLLAIARWIYGVLAAD